MISRRTITEIYQRFTAELSNPENDFIICTNVCKWIKDNYFPHGIITGYFFDDNPTAKIGEVEGGHDFLIVDGYIIDFWQRATYDKYFPLLIPRDQAANYYGNEIFWTQL